MLKFRTMPVDAEAATGPVWARTGEQRATPLGAFLRRSSLDELPQLLNVLKGDMSLVGPRPERPAFVEKFRHQIPGYMQKHLVKGGITGWAQVNDLRGDTDLTRRIEYDLYYIDNWSLLVRPAHSLPDPLAHPEEPQRALNPGRCHPSARPAPWLRDRCARGAGDRRSSVVLLAYLAFAVPASWFPSVACQAMERARHHAAARSRQHRQQRAPRHEHRCRRARSTSRRHGPARRATTPPSSWTARNVPARRRRAFPLAVRLRAQQDIQHARRRRGRTAASGGPRRRPGVDRSCHRHRTGDSRQR